MSNLEKNSNERSITANKHISITTKVNLHELRKQLPTFRGMTQKEIDLDVMRIGTAISDMQQYFTNELTVKQIAKFASTIIELNIDETLADIILAFRAGMSGSYGTIYPQITYGMLAGFVHSHKVERNSSKGMVS